MRVKEIFLAVWRVLGPASLLLWSLPFIIDPFLSDQYLMSRLIAFGLFLLLAFYWSKKMNQTVRFSMIDLLIVLFVLWHMLSSFWAINLPEAILNNSRWLLGLLAYIYFKYYFDESQKKNLFSSMHVVGLVYVIVVWIGIVKIGIEFGLSNKDLYRLQYPAGHKSLISAFIVLLMPFFLYDEQLSKLKWVSLPLAVGAVLILQSRAAFLGLMVVLIVGLVTYFKQKEPKKIMQLGGIFLILVLLTMALNKPAFHRLNFANYFQSQTAQERLLVWDKSYTLLQDNLLLGVGSGNWKLHLPSTGLDSAWVLTDRDVIFTRAHNDFIEIGVETGIPGLLIWLLILLLAIYTSLKSYSINNRFAFTFISAFSVIALLDFPKERVEHMLLFWLVLSTLRTKGILLRTNQKKLNITSMILVGVTLALMLPKYFGERQLFKVLHARAQKNWLEVISHAELGKNKLYSLDPYAIPIDWYAGMGHYQLGQMSQAHAKFFTAYLQHPHQYHVLNNLATTYFQQNQLDSAIYHYENCLAINPHFTDVYFNLAVAYTNNDEFDKARSVLRNTALDQDKVKTFLQEIDKKASNK